MVEFTFLEVHLDGAEFTANAPFADRSEAAETEEAESGVAGEDDGGFDPLPALLALGVLVLVVAVIRKLVGGGGADLDLDEDDLLADEE
ncbi:MAG: hypothetical protein ABEJ40_07775 [Haloarculaceae archaeon]